MKVKNIALMSLLLFTFNIISISAEENKESIGQPEKSKRKVLITKIDPEPFGLDSALGYRGLSFIDGLDTSFWWGLGASWKKVPFYRNADDKLITSSNLGGLDIDEDLEYGRLNINWSFGITQGIIWNDKIDANLLDISLFYRGRYDEHFEDDDAEQVVFNQNEDLQDMESIQQNSFLTGLSFNYIFNNKEKKVIKGVYSEISLEWGPSFLNKKANFLRLNFALTEFIPILSIPTKTSNNFSIYIGNYFVIDWIYGESIPINIRQSIGGLGEQRLALGSEVLRGIDEGRYDANFKLADCIDIRIVLPLKIPPDIVPGFIVYFDSGYYNQLEGTDSGFLFTTGFGLFFDCFSAFQLTAYTGFFLNGENIDGKKWKPFYFEFEYHF